MSWRDREEGEAGQAFRYKLYRSSEPIEDDTDLAEAELIADQILNNSGQLFGYGFYPSGRVDPKQSMSITAEGGEPLPLWSGLWVASVQENGCGYYAVIATNPEGVPVESVDPGVNATVEPVAEQVMPQTAMKVFDSADREGPYVQQTQITGTSNLPLVVVLHASHGSGGPVPGGDYGDYYQYFGDRSMGYQEGLPGIFAVTETKGENATLAVRGRDTIIDPRGPRPRETFWFGYIAEKLTTGEIFAYPFTRIRQDWIVKWTIAKYKADPNRVSAKGGSMGAGGMMLYALRHPETFSAIYPDRPRLQGKALTSLVGDTETTLLSGASWQEELDAVRFVQNHPEDLPFVGWNLGRRDGFFDWAPNIEMVQALTEGRHGFAFAWNNGDHSGGAESRHVIQRWYPHTKFARNESYPAFSNSSIDDDMGTGDKTDGDLEGGVNLGFDWEVTEDTVDRWQVSISNALAVEEMTVDVTPRRLQHFSPTAGEQLSYTDSLGGARTINADLAGLATVTGVRIQVGESTTITITR